MVQTYNSCAKVVNSFLVIGRCLWDQAGDFSQVREPESGRAPSEHHTVHSTLRQLLKMDLLILISAIVLFPQALTLTCKDCNIVLDCSRPTKTCSAEHTRCGLIRYAVFEGNPITKDDVNGDCFREDQCTEGSFNHGVSTQVFTTKCCGTDLCHSDVPALPSTKTNPNGLKCFRCDGKSQNCTATLNCDGDETFCASHIVSNVVLKGCATRSLCVNPPPQLPVHLRGLKCCEGNYCNSGSSTGACLLLLTSMLVSLFFTNTMLQ